MNADEICTLAQSYLIGPTQGKQFLISPNNKDSARKKDEKLAAQLLEISYRRGSMTADFLLAILQIENNNTLQYITIEEDPGL